MIALDFTNLRSCVKMWIAIIVDHAFLVYANVIKDGEVTIVPLQQIVLHCVVIKKKMRSALMEILVLAKMVIQEIK